MGPYMPKVGLPTSAQPRNSLTDVFLELPPRDWRLVQLTVLTITSSHDMLQQSPIQGYVFINQLK